MRTKSKVTNSVKAANVPGKDRAKDIREELILLNKTIDTSYLRLAKDLRESYQKEYYKSWGYDSLTDFASAELNIEMRKCQVLIQIADKIDEIGISESQAASLGWSKMRALIPVLTKKNCNKWMKEAEKSSLRDILQSVKIVKSNDPNASVPKITKLTFSLGEGAGRIVLEALEEAKLVTGTKDLSMALETVCQDWMEMKGNNSTKVALKDRIEFIEKTYAVKLKVSSLSDSSETKMLAEDEDANEPEIETKKEKKEVKSKTKSPKNKVSNLGKSNTGKKVKVLKGSPSKKDQTIKEVEDLFSDSGESEEFNSEDSSKPSDDLGSLFGMYRDVS